jgi:surface polysaccharide O-acyltransferase-like enzyme
MNSSSDSSKDLRPPEPRERNHYIDALRGTAIFGVVCIHFGGSFATSANAWTPSFYLGLFLNQFFSFAVPLFIFISGLLSGSVSQRSSTPVLSYYRQRLLRIGLPYLAASAASFVLFGHYTTWMALPSNIDRLSWLAQGLFYFGIEPTLFFIPLILQLYVLQPALRALPHWLHRHTEKGRPGVISIQRINLVLAIVLLIVHIAFATLCYRNILNYYTWGRPNPFFWLFYFYAGLHFRSLCLLFNRRRLLILTAAGLFIAFAAMAWSYLSLIQKSIVGSHFEFSKADYAYVRPEILIYNLSLVGSLSIGIVLAWTWKPGFVTSFGQSSLAIYLWHIILLYEIAWRYNDVLTACRQIPELIVFIAMAVCLVIAGVPICLARLIAYVRQFRVVIIKVS